MKIIKKLLLSINKNLSTICHFLSKIQPRIYRPKIINKIWRSSSSTVALQLPMLRTEQYIWLQQEIPPNPSCKLIFGFTKTSNQKLLGTITCNVILPILVARKLSLKAHRLFHPRRGDVREGMSLKPPWIKLGISAPEPKTLI